MTLRTAGVAGIVIALVVAACGGNEDFDDELEDREQPTPPPYVTVKEGDAQ